MLAHQRITADEFESFTRRPENAERLFELIAGEIVEVPSNPYASKFTMRIGHLFSSYLGENDVAHLTGEAGGCMVFGERYAPDVGVLLKSRRDELVDEGYSPLPPDLVVEVEHPVTTKSAENLTHKVGNYLSAGTTVWVIYPERKAAVVYAPGQQVRVLSVGDSLGGGDILPGFQLPLSAIFKD